MVRIRLCRVGAKKQPSYRLVVADQRAPRDGRFIEIVGNYNPRTDPPTVVVKEDRIAHWLSKGAQPSDAVARMLRNLEAAKLAAESEAVVEVDSETEAEVEAEVAAEAEIEVEPEVAAEAEAEAEVAVEVEAEAEVEPEVAAEAEAEVETDAEVEAEAKADSENESE